jgi:tetratricopeptide (TPR) repeat protein
LRDHGGAEADSRRALEINPNYILSLRDLAVIEIYSGRAKSGIKNLEQINALVPNEPAIPYYLSLIGLGNLLTGNQERALEFSSEAYERKPSLRISALILAAVSTPEMNSNGMRDLRELIKKHKLTVSDAGKLPFLNESDTLFLESRLREIRVSD